MAAKARELHVYDFDGTTFRSPVPSQELYDVIGDKLTQPVFAGGFGWFQAPITLHPPAVPEAPPVTDAYYVMSTLAKIDQSLADGHHVVILTGREQYFHDRVQQLIQNSGRQVHGIFLKQNKHEGTVKAKTQTICTIVAEHGPFAAVRMLDDREQQAMRLQRSLRQALGDSAGEITLEMVVDCSPSLPKEVEQQVFENLRLHAEKYQANSRGRGRGGHRGGGRGRGGRGGDRGRGQ